jgi:hypothetical protein
MKLGEFLSKFSHNNLIRLWYVGNDGHIQVEDDVNKVSMDWEVNSQKGCFRHYKDNKGLNYFLYIFQLILKNHSIIQKRLIFLLKS